MLRVIALSLALALGARAESVSNFNQWFAYWGDHQVQGRWGLHFDTHLRRTKFHQPQQALIRPGINFALRNNLQFQMAVTWLHTSSYGHAPSRPQLERRVWQQLTFQHRTGRIQWSHRGRWEHRWLPGGFEQRARYSLRATVPWRRDFYWSLAEETFFPVPPETHPAVVDQQRAIATLGKHLNEDWRVEFSYMYQAFWQRNGRIRENNHTLTVALFNTMPLSRLFRRLR